LIRTRLFHSTVRDFGTMGLGATLPGSSA